MKKIICLILLFPYIVVAQNKTYTTEDGLSSNRVFAIKSDSVGFMWFLTFSGIDRFDGVSFYHFGFEHLAKIERNVARQFYTYADTTGIKVMEHSNDPYVEPWSGKVWKIIYPDGVKCIDEHYPTFVVRDEFLQDNKQSVDLLERYRATFYGLCILHPTCCVISRDKLLYVGTANSGLYVLRKDRTGKFCEYAHYVKENSGLVTNTIYALIEDSSNTLVMSTSKGLARFYPSTKTFFHWLQVQGMVAGEFREHSVAIDDNGVLKFGTFTQTIEFSDTVRIPRSSKSKMVITNMYIGDNYLGDICKSDINVKYVERHLTFNITNICYDNPHEFLYRYSVDNGIWSHASRNNKFDYYLDRGSHNIHLQVLSSDDMSIVEEKDLLVNVENPWWFSFTAIFLYIMGFCVFSLLIISYLKNLYIKRLTKAKINLVNMAQYYELYKDSLIKNKEADKNKFLLELKDVLNANLYKVDFTIDDLCKELGMSRTVLYHKMKADTGYAPSEFMRMYRLECSKKLLGSTEMKISQIAYKCGFSDAKYFSDVFKKHTGITPSEFRKRMVSSV